MYLKFVRGNISLGKNGMLRAFDAMPIDLSLSRDFPSENENSNNDGVDIPTIKSDINTNVNNIGMNEQPTGMDGGRINRKLPAVRNKKANKFISIKL